MSASLSNSRALPAHASIHDERVPILFFIALVLFLLGNTLELSCALPEASVARAGTITKVAASLFLLTASCVHVVSDHSSALRTGIPHPAAPEAPPLRRALDWPAGPLQILTGILFIALNACFVSFVFTGVGGEAGSILFLVTAALTVVSTLLMGWRRWSEWRTLRWLCGCVARGLRGEEGQRWGEAGRPPPR